MTRRSAEVKAVDSALSKALYAEGFLSPVTSEISTVSTGTAVSLDCGVGSLTCAYSVARSTNRVLFVDLCLGLSCVTLSELFAELERGNSNKLSYPFALLSWSVGESRVGFDPSLEHLGMSFSFPEEDLENEISIVASRIPFWISAAKEYLVDGSVYDFYRFDTRIYRTYRWRELVALLKLLGGEEYIGMQLLNDLVDESAGRRPLGGDYDTPMYRAFGLRKNESELEFRDNLRKNAKRMIDDGTFRSARDQLEKQVREVRSRKVHGPPHDPR